MPEAELLAANKDLGCWWSNAVDALLLARRPRNVCRTDWKNALGNAYPHTSEFREARKLTVAADEGRVHPSTIRRVHLQFRLVFILFDSSNKAQKKKKRLTDCS